MTDTKTAATLTIGGYSRMAGGRLGQPDESGTYQSHRTAFDRWLQSEGLLGERIYEATFGEGVLHAKVHLTDDKGKPYLVDASGEPLTYPRPNKRAGDPDPTVAIGERTYTLKTPPPGFVFDYCD